MIQRCKHCACYLCLCSHTATQVEKSETKVKMYSEIRQIGIICLGWKNTVEIMQFTACSFAQICSDMCGYCPYEWHNASKSQKKKEREREIPVFY